MLGAPPDILCADQKCATSQQSPLRFHRTPQQADLFIVTSWGTSNFPPKSRRPEILASQEHTVCLVPHHTKQSPPKSTSALLFRVLDFYTAASNQSNPIETESPSQASISPCNHAIFSRTNLTASSPSNK